MHLTQHTHARIEHAHMQTISVHGRRREDEGGEEGGIQIGDDITLARPHALKPRVHVSPTFYPSEADAESIIILSRARVQVEKVVGAQAFMREQIYISIIVILRR